MFGAEQNTLTVQRDLSTRVEPQQQLSLNQHDTRRRPNTFANRRPAGTSMWLKKDIAKSLVTRENGCNTICNRGHTRNRSDGSVRIGMEPGWNTRPYIMLRLGSETSPHRDQRACGFHFPSSHSDVAHRVATSWSAIARSWHYALFICLPHEI